MVSTKELLARGKFFTLCVDAFIVIDVILETVLRLASQSANRSVCGSTGCDEDRRVLL